MSSMGLNRTASREQVIQGRQSTYILFLLLTIFPSLIWGQSGQRIKPISARQSSLGNQLGEAGNAIDGNTNGRWRFSKFTKNSVTHTGQENNPWWEVDLGDIYEINKVEIWRGSSCCPEVYDNLNILIRETQNGEEKIFSKFFFPTEENSNYPSVLMTLSYC